jgi:hypothetical protein
VTLPRHAPVCNGRGRDSPQRVGRERAARCNPPLPCRPRRVAIISHCVIFDKGCRVGGAGRYGSSRAQTRAAPGERGQSRPGSAQGGRCLKAWEAGLASVPLIGAANDGVDPREGKDLDKRTSADRPCHGTRRPGNSQPPIRPHVRRRRTLSSLRPVCLCGAVREFVNGGRSQRFSCGRVARRVLKRGDWPTREIRERFVGRGYLMDNPAPIVPVLVAAAERVHSCPCLPRTRLSPFRQRRVVRARTVDATCTGSCGSHGTSSTRRHRGALRAREARPSDVKDGVAPEKVTGGRPSEIRPTRAPLFVAAT